MKKENIWIIFALVITTVLSVIVKSELFQIIGAIFGILYVFGTAKENKYSQLFGVVNSAIYAYLMYRDRLYGTAIYDLIYCIPIQIYTFFTWGKDKNGKNKKEISRFTNKQRLLIAICLIIAIIIYLFIAKFLNINYAIVDAITIFFGILGLYLVSQKKIEEWYAFIISNIVTIVYWTVKCMESTKNLPMLLMWIVYLVNNSFGLYLWSKKIRDNKN